MAVWVVRAGRYGENEDYALETGLVGVGWNTGKALTDYVDLGSLSADVAAQWPDASPRSVSLWAGQLWAIRERIAVGDLVVLPLKHDASVAVGRIAGSYTYVPEAPDGKQHQRAVEWIDKSIPRTRFGQDLLYSFGSLLACFQVRRNDAEARIIAIASGQEDPGPKAPDASKASQSPPSAQVEAVEDDATAPNLRQLALDTIRRAIGERFHGHELAFLVSEILRAQGYKVHLAPPGKDGGIDLLAGRGALGFDEPRIGVQVKSGLQVADVRVVRELKGALPNFGASFGLVVSWGGFTADAKAEARSNFFTLRLWDSDDVIRELQSVYERIDERVQTDLPLERLWILSEEG
ncbi:MAG: restriction endonuclease [Alphaproteobacteria bacterium]|nr:restriction endonuclease [Alphaproteobacteria bacterium]